MASPTLPPGREDDPLAAGECPRCGTPFERLQEYCLECGQRLPREAGTRDALTTAAGRRTPWYAGDWVWPVLVALVVAVLTGAAAVAIAATRDGEGEGFLVATTSQPSQVLTGTPAVPQPSGPPAGLPTESVTLPEEVEPPPETQPPPPPPAARRLITWPRDQNGFTVVLASVPQGSRTEAVRKARDASDAGLDDVGVLDSSRYPSLHAGYLVVFSGVHPTLAQAREASVGARERGYADAYAAQVAR